MSQLSLRQTWPSLLGFIALCWVVQGLSGLATASSVGTWYAVLQKPSWTPPGWVFGPVWAALYTMMGISAWLVWRHHVSVNVRIAMLAFGVQLTLNGLWSVLFFGLNNLALASIEIALLWLAIVWSMVEFARINKLACWILLPYLAWVSFAMGLTFSIWSLNS